MSQHAQTAGPGGNGRNRRRQYVINPTFQWKYAFLTATAVFLITSILSSILYGLLHHQARMRLMHPETYTAEVTLVILFFGVAFAGVSAIGVGVWSIMVTHRFCGPLYVMERAMNTLAQGRLPKLRDLRRKDEFKAFYASFTRAVEVIRERRTADLEALRAALATARSGLDADDGERREVLERVIASMSELQARAEAGVIEQAPGPDGVPETATEGTPVAAALG